MTVVSITVPVKIQFEQEGGILRAKPFPSFPTFTDIYVGVDAALVEAINAQIEALEATDIVLATGVTDAAALALAAQSDATTALSNAAAAQVAADAAQSTADDALAAAASLVSGVLLIPDMAHNINGGFGAPTAQAGQQFGQYNTMGGLNTECEFKVLLEAGNYTMTICYVKLSSGGIVTMKCDGTTFTTVDTYNATTQLAQIGVVTMATGLSAGLHTINLKVGSKNGASSSYNFLLSYLAIRKV